VLRWRLISATIIISVLLALIWLDFKLVFFVQPGGCLLPLLLLISVLGTEELLSLLAAKDQRPIASIAYLGNIAVPVAVGWPIVAGMAGLPAGLFSRLSPVGLPLVVLALAIVLIFVGEMARYQRPGNSIVQAALGVFAILYIGLLIGFWAVLRLHRGNDWGMMALVSMLLVTKMADTGAFATGKLLGRHKMMPVLSPGKTWEGAIGGIATACLTSWLFFHFAGRSIVVSSTYIEPAVAASIAYGVLLAIAGMIGDLAESLLKRDMGRKDSSTWLPGLGGILDIIDAPLVAGPVAWLCWTLGLFGP
jgi:phosphatidate cytidylyltransferase